MDVILFAGQSNMQGQTESCPDMSPVEHALEYRFLTNTLVPLRHPVGENIGDLLRAAAYGNGSLVPSFCKAYVQKTGKEVTAVSIARGDTTIAQWHPTDSYHRARMAVRKAQEALRAVKESGKEVERVYFVWLQGESDALASTPQDWYRDGVIALRNLFAREVGIDQFCIIRVGKFANDDRDFPIMRAQEELGTMDGYTLLTRATGICTKDPERYINPYYRMHLSNAGMELVGTRAGEALANLRMGLPIELEEEPYDELK